MIYRYSGTLVPKWLILGTSCKGGETTLLHSSASRAEAILLYCLELGALELGAWRYIGILESYGHIGIEVYRYIGDFGCFTCDLGYQNRDILVPLGVVKHS